MVVPANGVVYPGIDKYKATDAVPIMLDDEPRTLRMTFRAMKIIREKTGITMWRSGAFDLDTLEPDTLGTIIWASLLHESPDLELDDVMNMPHFTLANFHYVLDCLLALWGTSVPQPDEQAENMDPKELEPALSSLN